MRKYINQDKAAAYLCMCIEALPFEDNLVLLAFLLCGLGR